MLNLKTKKNENLKVVTILLKPTTMGHETIFICIDKDKKPVEVLLKDIDTLGA